jgi:putative spermidine/putrescine transport system ATP-binding protein
VGTPAEVYESPANTFVAGFVGSSNVVAGELATAIRGRPDPFTVRPEKISVGLVPEGGCRAEGVVRDVEYLGMFTRYRVEVDGTELIAVRQNLEVSHRDLHGLKGTRVVLGWSEASCRPIALEAKGGTGEEEPVVTGPSTGGNS